MANEAKPVRNTQKSVRQYTISDANSISYGTLLAIVADPNVASGGTGAVSGGFWGGIALADKVAGEGDTLIAADISGVWDLTCSGAVPLGNKVILAGGNKIQAATIGIAGDIASGGRIVGTAMETGSDGEVIEVDLDKI